MYRGHTIGVIVPAYNEEAHVGTVLETMPDFVDRIYAVDDRSTDDTWAIIQEHASSSRSRRAETTGDDETADTDESDDDDDEGGRPLSTIPDGGTIQRTDERETTERPEIVPIRHAENQGAGGALRTGYIRARDDGTDVAVTMDADGQMDPDQLPRLLDPIVEGRAGYAKGNRLADRSDRREMPPFRLFGNWLLTQLTKVASGYWRLQDPQNGYTAISHEALSAIDVESMPDDHDYPNDLLVRLNIADVPVADVAMPARYDDEESTIRYRTFIPVTSVTLFRGFCRRLRAQFAANRLHPTVVCYVAGVVCLTMALASTAFVASGQGTDGTILRPLASAGLAFLTAIAVLLLATVLDARANADLGVRH